MPGTATVLFTDLDGTLLDHDTYQPGPAAASLTDLLTEGVDVYFCSAKTRVEQTMIAEQLDVMVGFIVENGAGVYQPNGEEAVLGTSYPQVRAALHEAADAVGARVRGYGDMELEEIMSHTGLDAPRAEHARNREFTESFVMDAGDSYELGQALAERGLRLQRGSRFWIAQGNHDKGRAVRHVVARYGEGVESLAIGDFDNDLEMLAAVDVPMLVQRPGGTWRLVPVTDLMRLDGIGPLGWIRGADLVLRRHLSR